MIWKLCHIWKSLGGEIKKFKPHIIWLTFSSWMHVTPSEKGKYTWRCLVSDQTIIWVQKTEECENGQMILERVEIDA